MAGVRGWGEKHGWGKGAQRAEENGRREDSWCFMATWTAKRRHQSLQLSGGANDSLQSQIACCSFPASVLPIITILFSSLLLHLVASALLTERLLLRPFSLLDAFAFSLPSFPLLCIPGFRSSFDKSWGPFDPRVGPSTCRGSTHVS
eukprot:473195-Hanusia_phi.AAC.1